ncbi:MAG TPA: NAD-dependent epimerase/dehydratase family protein [Bacteroidales bacterium]|nr:NAD-dependent epimerase/dehydratase family protein [Bacteroidales bacterium]
MIFITGSTGLIGAHLLYRLVQKGEKVKALIRNPDKIEQVKHIFSYYTENPDLFIEKIEWVTGDILDPASYYNALTDVREVYHCAAMVSFDKKDEPELLKTNIEGTANMVNASLEHRVKKFCFVSSVAALGESENGKAVTEDDYWVPSKIRSPYAISKFKSEMEVWRGIQEGLTAVIVNPSVILGPGFWNSGSGTIFTKAAKGMLFYTKGSTGFVDVRDVVHVMIKLMEDEIKNQRFIINAENIVYKDLFDRISEAVSVRKPKVEATRTMLNIAGGIDGLLSAFGIKKRELTKDVVRSSLSKSTYSNRKVKELLTLDFIPVEKTIREMAELYRRDLTER